MGSSIYNKYSPDHSFPGKRVLNIGCGFAKYPYPNVVNLDAFDVCKPDVVWDLNKTPYPFKDGEFDFIIANHILEHLPNWWGCFAECGRLLKENGILEIWIPDSASDSAVGYRDHVNIINNCSFFGTFGTYREASNAWASENAKSWANWLKLTMMETRMENHWWIQKAPNFARQWMFKHLRNITSENGYRFRKVTTKEYEQEVSTIHARASVRDSVVAVPKLQEADAR